MPAKNGLVILLLLFYLQFCKTDRVLPEKSEFSAQAKVEGKAQTIKWEKRGTSPLNQEEEVKIQFIGDDVGWLATKRGLWKSIDGGRSWEIKLTNNTNSYTDYEFVSHKAGWVRLNDGFYLTNDGGGSWKKITFPPVRGKATLSSLKMSTDGKSLWMAGEIYEKTYTSEYAGGMPNKYLSPDGKKIAEPVIFFSSNNGKTWSRQKLEKNSSLGSVVHLTGFSPVSAWAIGSSGEVFRYAQASWQIVTSFNACPESQNIISSQSPIEHTEPVHIFFADLKTGWVIFRNGYLAKTDDSGSTWCLLKKEKDWPILHQETTKQCIQFANSKIGIWDIDFSLYLTRDGGLNWQLIEEGVDAFSLADDSKLFLIKDGEILIAHLTSDR